MKDVEIRLISELMKNSRRSDRELAKVIGVSQPTVSRLRLNLQKEGYIQEYTVIPNFEKLGYEILAFTFVKHVAGLEPEKIRKARNIAQRDFSEKAPTEIARAFSKMALSSGQEDLWMLGFRLLEGLLILRFSCLFGRL